MTDPNTKTPLSQRLRPDCEAAPWVIEAVRQLEVALECATAAAAKAETHGKVVDALRRGDFEPLGPDCDVCQDTGGVTSHMNNRDTWHPCPRGCKAEAKLAEALEPVAIVQHSNRIEWLEDFPAHCAKPGTKLYAATPAPAVPDAEAMAQAASDFFADMTNDDNTLAFDHCSSYDIDMLVAAMLSAAPKPEAL